MTITAPTNIFGSMVPPQQQFVNFTHRQSYAPMQNVLQIDSLRRQQTSNGLGLAPAATAPPTWTEIGPDSGAIELLTLDPFNSNVIFAGSHYGGLYRSTTGGSSWKRVGYGLTDFQVTSITANPGVRNQFFVTTSYGGVFSSNDGGNSWMKQTVCGNGAQKYVVDAQNPMNQYVLCPGLLMISHDGGSTWTSAGLNFFNISMDDLEVVSGVVYGLEYDYSIDQSVVIKSLDGGMTWARLTVNVANFFPNGGTHDLAVNPVNTNIMLLSGQSNVVVSSDGGNTWRIATSQPIGGMVHGFVSFQSASVAYAGRIVLFRSTDSGQSFQQVFSACTQLYLTTGCYHVDLGAIAFDSAQNTIFVGTDGGVDASMDNGVTWQPLSLSSGMRNGLTYSVGIDPFQQGDIIVTRQDWGPTRTTDGGADWQQYVQSSIGGAEGGNVAFDPVSSGVVYIATLYNFQKSTDHGQTFTVMNNGLPAFLEGSVGKQMALDPTNHNTIWLSYFTGTNNVGGVFKSTDGGGHWNRVGSFSSAVNVQVYGQRVYVNEISPSFSYSLWRSLDGGSTWTMLSVPVTSNPIYPYSVSFDPIDPNTIYVIASGALFKSSDSGNTFTVLQTPQDALGFQGGPLLLQQVLGTVRITMGPRSALSGNLYQSTDSGKTWTRITSNINVTDFRDIEADPSDPNRLYVATFGEGVVTATLPLPPPVIYYVTPFNRASGTYLYIYGAYFIPYYGPAEFLPNRGYSGVDSTNPDTCGFYDSYFLYPSLGIADLNQGWSAGGAYCGYSVTVDGYKFHGYDYIGLVGTGPNGGPTWSDTLITFTGFGNALPAGGYHIHNGDKILVAVFTAGGTAWAVTTYTGPSL